MANRSRIRCGIRANHLGLIALILQLSVSAAWANPVILEPHSMLAFAIVVFWALVVESGIVTLALISSGVSVVRTFLILTLGNGGLFVFGFLPLLDEYSLWLLESGVVLADASLVKIVAALPFLQDDRFVGVSWRRALLASFLGNLASFFVGVIAGSEP